MDNNTTVAVDILVRTTMNGAATDFSRQLARMESDVKSWVARINAQFARVRGPNLGSISAGTSGGSVTAGRGDPAMARAQADIARMQAQRTRWENDYTKLVTTQAEKQYKARTASVQKGGAEFMRVLDQQKLAETKFGASGASFGTIFGANLGANIVARLGVALAQIPSMVGEQWDKAIKIASERQNALKGLESIATFKGVDAKAAQDSVMNLRLVKAGVIDVANATTSLKNLLATGFSLPEAITLLEGFSDTASFGKQNALSFGEAIRGATEGIKNQNSILVDNAGVTKNLSVILKEAGKSEKDLMSVTTDASVRTALYTGLLKEMQGQRGDADKLVKTYTGSEAALNMAYLNLYNSVGQMIIQSPQMLEANRLVTEQITGYTKETNKADGATRDFIENAIELYAKFKVGVIGTLGSILSTFGYVVTGMATGLGAILTVAATPIDIVLTGISKAVVASKNAIADVYNYAQDFVNNNPTLATVAGLGFMVGGQRIQADNAGLEYNFDLTKELSRATANLGDATVKLFNQAERLQSEANKAMSQISAKRPKQNLTMSPGGEDDDYMMYRAGKLPYGAPDKPKTFLDPATLAGGGTGGGKGSSGGGSLSKAGLTAFASDRRQAEFLKALRTLDPALKSKIAAYAAQYSIPEALALAQIFSESTFNKTAVSDQGAYGLTQFLPATASRVMDRNVSKEELLSNTDTALTAWGKYMTSLFNEFGDWEMAAFAYHNGEGNARAFVKALQSGSDPKIAGYAKAHPKGVAYSRQLTALASLSKDEQFGTDFANQSDRATQASQDAQTRSAIDVMMKLGLIPDGAVLRNITKMRTEEARQTGIAQPQESDIIGEFKANRDLVVANRQTAIGDISTTDAGAGGKLQLMLSDREQYVQTQKDGLKIQERETALLERTRYAQENINVLVQERDLQRREALADAKDELALAEARKPLLEGELRFEQSKVEQMNLTRDMQADIDAMRRQNLDEAFIAQRGLNDELTIQLALLYDIEEIRGRDRDAIIESNRAMLEINQQTQYSAAQSNSQVLQFMASQKGVTQIMGDFKIGMIESGYELIDAGLDKILPKMGRMSSVIKDMIASFIKLGLNWAFRKLFGIDTSGGGKSGGAAGGILNTITGGVQAGVNGGNAQVGGSPSVGGFLGGIPGAAAPPSRSVNLGSILPGLTGQAVSLGPGGTPTEVAPGTGLNVGQPGGIVGTAANAASSAGGKLGFLKTPGLLAGAMLGLGLGNAIGGGRGFAGILGSVGGAVAGGAAGVIAGGVSAGGIAGASAIAAALPFAFIGAGILIAAFFLGRAARARREKKQVNQWSGDAVAKMKQLLADVKAMKITGSEAYNSGVQIRDAFAEQLTQLKDKGAKKLGQTKLAEINGMLATLKIEGERTDRTRAAAKVTDEKLVPTFASGGFTGMSYGTRSAVLHSHEAVLSQQNIMSLGGYRALQDAGVRGMPSLSGAADRPSRGRSRSGGGGASDVYIVGVFDSDTADAMMDKVSALGVAKKVKFSAKHDLGGMLDEIGKKMAGTG